MKNTLKTVSTLIVIFTLTLQAFAQQNEETILLKMASQGDLVFEKTTDTIPLNIWNDQIILDLKINGKNARFMWDNGFSFSALDQKFANTLKLSEIENLKSVEASDAVNVKVNLDIKITESIAIGSAIVKQTPVTLTNLQTLFIDANYPVNGILGATVIKKLNWKFNFDENYVVISIKPFQAEGIKIPVMVNQYNTMLTMFGVNGELTDAEIDFGYNGDDVPITTRAATLFQDSKKNKLTGQSTSSVSGLEETTSSYMIKEFNYIIGDTTTTVPHKFKLHLTDNERQVRFGNRFFRHYNPIVNIATNEIILLSRKTPISQMPEKSYGFIIMKMDGQLRVVVKSNNPNVDQFPNLKLQDIILEIDGKKASYFKDNVSLKEYQINALKENKAITFKREDGKKFTLVPQDNIYE